MTPTNTRRQFLAASLGLIAAPALAAVPARPLSGLLADPGQIDPALRARALAALARHRGRLADARIIAIADFSRRSADARFHLLDTETGRVESVLVAHGRGSDPAHMGWLQRFSNAPGSNASCHGAFLTSNEYHGKHGRSQRLIGLDATNSNALDRAIVIHSAPYVSAGMARQMGKVGRSQGCFTLTAEDLGPVMARLGQGRLIYADKVGAA